MDIRQVVNLGLLQYAGADDRYVPLEYLESTGGQYINTGFVANQDTSVLSEWHVSDDTPGNGLFGAYGQGYAVDGYGCNGTNHFYDDYGDDVRLQIGLIRNARFTYSKEKNVTSITGGVSLSYTHPAKTFSTIHPITLFRFNANGVPGHVDATRSSARCYYFKIWDNGVLVRDLVPMLRLRDGKPGMYDRAHGRFYVNKGTGEFQYERAYITDGLVLWLDAINNTRNGHDANAQTWDNLASDESYAFASGKAMEWEDDCLVMPGTKGAAIDVGFLGSPQNFTFEVVFMRSAWKYQATCFSCTESGGVGWQSTTVSYERPLIARKDSVYYPYPSDAIHDTSLSRHYKALTASVAYGKCLEYIGGDVAQPAIAEAYTGTHYNQLAFNLGTDAPGGADNTNTMLGHYCACRVYSRALSPEEIAHNYAIDRLRFNLA